jgi:hypothetical protein
MSHSPTPSPSRRLAGSRTAAALAAILFRPVDRIEPLDDHRRDRMTGQGLDRLDREPVGRCRNGEGMARLASAPGAPDAMDVVLGVVRHIEIEHM